MLEADLIAAINQAGFEAAMIIEKHHIFEDVANPSSALKYGTIGITLKAMKPA